MKLLNLVALFFAITLYGQVYINEIDPDTPSTDVKEFIELHSTNPNTSLNGYVLVFFNAGSTAPYSGTLSYYAIDLDGYTTDINGNFLIGNSQVSPTPALDLPETTLQNGPDAIALYLGNATDFPTNTAATATNLVHAIAYSNASTTQPSALMTILNLTTCINENATSNAANHSIQRKTDGTFEVKTPTPGMNNDGSGIVLNYLTTTLNATSYTEGQQIVINFTLTNPVASTTIFSIALTNGNFTTSDYSGTTSLSIASGSSSTSTTITLTDDNIDEGDEEFVIVISGLPTDIVPTTNSILRRVADNDYVVLNFGTPLNPTYNTVSSTAPANYYASLEGLSGTALRQAIQDIIANPAIVHLHSYADIWEILKTADQNPANSSQVWCMYIEQPMSKIDQQQGNSIVGKWNREHIFCQSRGGFQAASNDIADGINVWTTTSASSTVDGVSDAHHIRAENGQENSSRNNKNYGLVNSSTVYAGPTTTQGSWKGDVARALFYMAVRFNGLNVVNGDPSEYNGTNPSGNIGDLATLLSWHTQDPRDDYEMNRNNYVYTWQHNRNPFIDYPSLVSYVFGSNYGQPWSSALSVATLEEEKVKVFPNPTTDYIQIEGITATTRVQIANVTGQLIYQNTIEQNQRLPLDLEAGIYFVTLSSQEKLTTKKIIVK